MSHLARSAVAVLLAWALTGSALANLGGTDDEAADNPDVKEAQKALQAQEWNRAIGLLEKAATATPDSADVQNFLGYAHRKAGNLESAFKHYQAALKLNPQHKPTHEYIGEAYLMSNELVKAEQHLAELQRLCTPIPCEEWRELKRAVDEYKKTRK